MRMLGVVSNIERIVTTCGEHVVEWRIVIGHSETPVNGAVCGVVAVGLEEAAALGIRESQADIIDQDSAFVPHFITP